MKKYIWLLLTNITVFTLTYVYMNIENTANSVNQSIAERYYYFNFLLKEGEVSMIKHLSSLVASDVIALGKGKININDFSNTYQHTYLCVGNSKKKSHIFMKNIDTVLISNDRKDFLRGLILISNFCEK